MGGKIDFNKIHKGCKDINKSYLLQKYDALKINIKNILLKKQFTLYTALT